MKRLWFRLIFFYPRQAADLSRRFVQLTFNRRDYVRRKGVVAGGEAGDEFAVSADQKLGEVPFDVAAELRVGRFAGQKRVQGGLMRRLDTDLAEQVKRHMVGAGAELMDLAVAARLLLPEIVGREREYPQAPAPVLLVQSFQRLVLGRVSAQRRRVDDHHDFAGVAGQWHRLPGNVLNGVAQHAFWGRRRGVTGQRGEGKQGKTSSEAGADDRGHNQLSLRFRQLEGRRFRHLIFWRRHELGRGHS